MNYNSDRNVEENVKSLIEREYDIHQLAVRLIGNRYPINVIKERKELFSILQKNYIGPLAGLVLRRTSNRFIAKLILWLLYPNFHMGNNAETAWEALDSMIFGNTKMLKMM